MSNVSNRHPLQLFTAGDKALATQRLAKVGYKSTTKNPAKYPSVCASVPQVDPIALKINADDLLPHLATLIEDTQDAIIRQKYEDADGALIEITDEDISIPACVSYLNAAALGDKLSKDAINTWFDSVVFDACYAIVSMKLSYGEELTEEQDLTVRKHVEAYKQVFALLAGKNIKLTPNQLGGLELALENCEVDAMTRKIAAKVDALKAPPKAKVAELLF